MISNGVTGIFHRRNPSIRTMSLGLTQPLNRNEYRDYFLGGGGGVVVVVKVASQG
jgi:hypothetical protein